MAKNFTIRPHGLKPYHTGLSVPIFSLRTKNSFGVGQFSDLKILADFVHKSGMDVIQLLPVNDTTIFTDWKDSSPYRANSVFALHPIYLDFSEFLSKLSKAEAKSLLDEALVLNNLQQVDYEKVLAYKWRFAKLIYSKFSKEIFERTAFKEFYEARKIWLAPYACFCYFRDHYHTSDFELWKEKRYSKALYEELSEHQEIADILKLHIMVQFLLHKQLKEAKRSCRLLP